MKVNGAHAVWMADLNPRSGGFKEEVKLVYKEIS